MKSLSEETHRTKYFHSIADYQSFILSHMGIASRYAPRDVSAPRGERKGGFWFGRDDIKTTRAAIDALSSPTPRQMKMAETMRSELMKLVVPEPKIVRRKKRLTDDCGDIDVDRYLDGDSDFFRQNKREVRHGMRIISLWINNGYHCKIHSDDINWNAVTGVVLADILESQGYAVELNVLNESHGAYKSGIRNSFVGCRIKAESDALNFGSALGVISAVGHRFAHFTAKTAMGPAEVTQSLGRPQELVDPGHFVDCHNTEYYFLKASVSRADAVIVCKNVLAKIEASHTK